MTPRILPEDERTLRFFVYAAFTGVFLSAAYLRLKNITLVGFSGNDPCLYWQTAVEWSKGNFILGKADGYIFYRPALYAFHTAALALFDGKEYSLRLLTALVDLGNITLVYFAGLRISRSRLPGLFAAALYSLSPLVLQNARTELAHAPSTTFVLIALLLFFAGTDEPERPVRKRLFAFFSGTALALAAGMHEDLVCLAPGFVVGYAVVRRGTFSARLGETAASGFWFSFGFFFLLLLPVPFFGAAAVLKGFTANAQFTASNLPFLPAELSFRIFTQGVSRLFSWDTAALFLLTIGASIFLASGMRGPARAFLPLLLIASYAFSYELLATRNDITTRLPRVLIPLAPLVALFIGVWGWEWLRRLPVGRLLLPLYFAGGVACAWGDFLIAAENHVFLVQPTMYRKLHDILGARTGPESRVLLAPSIVTNAKRCFQTSAYFGEDAVYLYDCTKNGPLLERFAREKNIRYVFVANALLRPPSLLARRHPEACFGWPDTEYSLAREEESLKSYIASRNGRSILSEPYFGEIFELEQERGE